MLKFLRGIDIPPIVVVFARGIVEAAVMAALIEIGVVIGQIDWGDKTILVPVAWWLLRTGEGVADHIDPAKTRKPTA